MRCDHLCREHALGFVACSNTGHGGQRIVNIPRSGGMRWPPVASCVDDATEHQSGEAWLGRTECRHEPHRINRLHVDVERLTRGRFDGDLRCLPVALLAPVPGSPRVPQLSLDCLTRQRGIQKRSRSFLADHKNRLAATDSLKASLAPQPFRQIHGLTKRPISSTNCSHNLNGTSATVPKDHGAVMAAWGALQSARISGLVEAMPPYRG